MIPMDESFPDPIPRSRPIRVNMFSQLWRVFFVGIVIASIYTAWTPLGLVPYGINETIDQIFSPLDESLSPANPTATPRPPQRIGIVAGHYGNDTGAVCDDGLQEVEINLEVATRVKEQLTQLGYAVDLLQEKDERLQGYQGRALVSIHADSCIFVNQNATGFKVAAALATTRPDKAQRLVNCMVTRYEEVTSLNFHAGSITEDMTSYHAFDEIDPDTAAVIIEIGFMNLDRQILNPRTRSCCRGSGSGHYVLYPK